MQDHRYDFIADGTPEEIWELLWSRKRTGMETDKVKIEIYHPGDEDGNGLVRHCHFPVPRYLLSSGRAQSWEWITESKPPFSWRYDAIGKPLWSKASGWTRLDDLGGGKTRVYFRETYEVFNPLLRVLLEARVHHFISRDNDKHIENRIAEGLHTLHAERGQGANPNPADAAQS